MKELGYLFCIVWIFASCQSDERTQESMAGHYKVTINEPESMTRVRNAIVPMKEQMKGESSGYLDDQAIMAPSVTFLMRALKKFGIDPRSQIIQIVDFDADLQPDGTIVVGRKKRIVFDNDTLHWNIHQNKFVLIKELPNNQIHTDTFEIIKSAEKEFDLDGEMFKLHLAPIK